MLIKQIIKQTVDLQGFRVHTVTKNGSGLVAEIVTVHRAVRQEEEEPALRAVSASGGGC